MVLDVGDLALISFCTHVHEGFGQAPIIKCYFGDRILAGFLKSLSIIITVPHVSLQHQYVHQI